MAIPTRNMRRRLREREAATNGNQEDATKNDLAELVEKGIVCDNRNVYYSPVDGEPDKFHWVNEKPQHLGAERGKTKQQRETYAVNILWKYKERDDEWFVFKLQINNAKIQSALEKVLEGYPGLTQYDMGSFSPPFLPFIHRWDEFLKAIENEQDEATQEYLEILQETLEIHLQEPFDRFEAVKSTGHVSFVDLDFAFNPGDIAFRSSNGLTAAGIFREGAHKQNSCGDRYYQATVDVVDWDGRRCGLLAQHWNIPEYRGLRSIAALEVSPLDYHRDKEEIRARLIQRGRIFENLRGQFFMAYTDEHEERVNERSIIDARAYHKHGPKDPYEDHSFPDFASLEHHGRLTWEQSMNRYSSNPPNSSDAPMEVDLAPLTDELCLLAVATVKCFNIEKKTWAELDLTKFHDIPWSNHAFDSLVLDSEEKDLLLALVDREELITKSFDDFINGKGQGMIMLLSGPPGVGKTLTAESVAEHLRRPLYRLGAGDLGISASSVEECLDSALKLCSHWNAVLLIDEADVFMEARTANNLQRNELVSVFLRLLEYYSGIMILTTNRMHSIDTAFESRIDITLTYNSLTEGDRKQVWRNFLRMFNPSEVDVSDTDIDELAKWDFNGRQIKSAIKTARILGVKKREPLNIRHLNVVLNLRSKALSTMA